ncbi:MAG: ribosome biogenesis GTP-binding protein YihA/YsxC [Patescibacteria group bacterium]|jgi:GTP-binding protein
MQVKFLKSLTKLEDLPRSEKPQVAFVGRSNVGKSSLINHLCNQKNLARVSAEPGRTRTINLFDVDNKFFLVDLPGYGYAKASKDKREEFLNMLNDYLGLTEQLKLVFLIIDARIGATDLDREMLNYLKSNGTPFVLILNKADKLSNSESANLLRTLEAGYPGVELILHSNISGKGRNEILKAIQDTMDEKA